MPVPVDLKQLGIIQPCTVTDLWTGKVLGRFTGTFSPQINRHGAGMYKITAGR
ncbi:MAG: hypothetical protein INR73_09565 [Williamsia sp.]|nr:hypothetical protein [Williamsia sp.]